MKKLNIKFLLLSVIIFSNDFFGKEFDQIFQVYTPISNSSEIEKSINNSFNIMIYRLSGSQSPSNIWKIINAGNTRKDFIKSYSLRNIEGDSYLEVVFNKDYLIKVFNKLSIPIVGNARPVILFKITIDSGAKNPYLVPSFTQNNNLESKINKFLKHTSLSRGVFLELPELDLFDFIEIEKYKKLINVEERFSLQYQYDFLSEINIVKTGPNNWSVSGDIAFEFNDGDFENFFMNEFDVFVNKKIDYLLQKKLIDTAIVSNLDATFKNINSYEDYKNLKKIINGLIGIKSTNMSKFDNNIINYDIEIYGGLINFVNEISDNSYLNIISFNVTESEIIMSFEP